MPRRWGVLLSLSGRYQLVRKLATGGMAEVFLARAVGPGGFEKTLVVKRILPQLAERESFVQMFFAEARVAAQLAHPNLLQIFDFGEDEGTYFIAMEFVDGVNLRTLSKWATTHEPVSPAIAGKLISLSAEGLAWAHDFVNPDTGEPMGLVHRDVSPDNIMVSRTGAVKVLDFGVVRIEGEDNGTNAGVLKGKVAYMPREQIRGEVLDRRVDVYSLGAVLYLLLTGQRPYERPSEISLMNAILTEEATPILSLRPDLPEELVGIVERAMAVDRDERFSSCVELHDALERFLSTVQAVTTTQLGQLAAKVQQSAPGTPDGKSGTGSRSGAGSAPGTATPARLSVGQAPLVRAPVVQAPEAPAFDGPPLDDEGPTTIAPVPLASIPSTTSLMVDPFKTVPGMPAPATLAALRARVNAADAQARELAPEPVTPTEGPSDTAARVAAALALEPTMHPVPETGWWSEEAFDSGTPGAELAPSRPSAPGPSSQRSPEAPRPADTGPVPKPSSPSSANRSIDVRGPPASDELTHPSAPSPAASSPSSANRSIGVRGPPESEELTNPSAPRPAPSSPSSANRSIGVPPPAALPPPRAPLEPKPPSSSPSSSKLSVGVSGPPEPDEPTHPSAPMLAPSSRSSPRLAAVEPGLSPPAATPPRATSEPKPPTSSPSSPKLSAAPAPDETTLLPAPRPAPSSPSSPKLSTAPAPEETTLLPAPRPAPSSPSSPKLSAAAPDETTLLPAPRPAPSSPSSPKLSAAPPAPDETTLLPAPRPAPSSPSSPRLSALVPAFSPPDASPPRASTGLTPPFSSSGSGQQSSPARSFQPGPDVPWLPATIACSPTRGPSVAVLSKLKAEAMAERSSILVRKFFPVAARLMEVAPDLAPWVQWHAGAMLDAALVAEEHSIVSRLLERIGQAGGRFASWLVAELSSARVWLQLVERLRRGMPADAEAFEKWVGALGPVATPLVLTAIDALEPGPAQELLCRALAPMMGDPTPVISRLDGPAPKNVVMLAYLLELCPAALDRKKVFARLLTRREVGFVAEVMTGRAKARGPETLQQLEVGFGSRAPEIRVRALELMAQLEAPEVAKILQPLTTAADFDSRPEAERVGLWTAVANSKSPTALAAIAALFASKPSLLTRKKVVQQRRVIVEGLTKATRDEARALLKTLAADADQPDEVRAAAQAGVVRPSLPTERLTPEQAVRLRKLVVLDLCSLVRAATATDVMGGQLDGALGRLREELRLVVTHEGKFELGVGADGVTVNGAVVPLAFGETPVAPEVARLLSACDLRSFKLEVAVPVAELRAALAQLCDPDGTAERAPHVQVTTASGRVLQPRGAPEQVADAPAAAVALYAGAIGFLKQQRLEVETGKMPSIPGAARLVDGWVLARRAGGARLLAVSAAPVGDRFTVHALNTASIATAFGADLQLDTSTLRELAELSMFWTLGEEGLSIDPRRPVGGAPPEELRLRLGLIFVSQLKHRRGPSAAVSAFEVGMERPTSSKVRGAGTVASIVAMAEAWDALALEDGRGHVAALEVLRSRHANRFPEELFALFVQWVEAQLV